MTHPCDVPCRRGPAATILLFERRRFSRGAARRRDDMIRPSAPAATRAWVAP